MLDSNPTPAERDILSEVTAEAAEGIIVPAESHLPEFRNLYDPELDFRKLALESAYHARGFRLVDKNWLIAVPHVVISAIYRPGFMRGNIQGDYCSLEAVVADAETMDLPQVRHGYAQAHGGSTDLYVYPNEPVVYNDGSTGIRRTITQLLNNLGMIDVGTNNDYDRPFSVWKAGADEAQTGFMAFSDGKPFRYLAARGLRRSDYEWQGQPATTFYFG